MERFLRGKLKDGTFGHVSAVRSRMMGAVRGRGNKTTEVRLRFALVSAGVRGWQMHPRGMPGKPDFYFASSRLAVFADGCFWHGCPRCGHTPRKNSAFWQSKIERNRQRDARVVQTLEADGVVVLRFWECELARDAVR